VILQGGHQHFASPEAVLVHRRAQSLKQDGLRRLIREKPFASPEAALAHFGVKGMKWGVRKKEETSPREAASALKSLSPRKQKKVDKFIKRAEIMGTKISELRLENQKLQGRNPVKMYGRYYNNQMIKNLEQVQARALKDAEAVQKGRLTSTQKRVIVGAVVVGAIIAAGAFYAAKDSGALNQFNLLRKSRGLAAPFKTNPKLGAKMSASDILSKVAKPINPGYSKLGGRMNCRRATYAYELRRRGFDVHATTSTLGWGQSESGVINAVTPGARNFYRRLSVSDAIEDFGTATKAIGDKRSNPLAKQVITGLRENPFLSDSTPILRELAKQPEGARGEVLLRFKDFGHSMAYEIIGGVVHIFDGQKANLFGADTKIESKWNGFHSADITRLDNVDLDYRFLTRWATDVKGEE